MKKGISLVALVVTIVVLIILTAAVVLTINNDSIFDKADDAVKKQNELEAYSAVQMEVMQVRLQNIGEPIGGNFADLLQERLNEKYPSANAAVEYSDAKGEIGISYTLNRKEYKMILAKGYKLTMENGSVPGNGGDNGENTPGSATIEEERAIIQAIFDKMLSGTISPEEAMAQIPEGWIMDEELFADNYQPIYTAGGNTFLADGEGIVYERIGIGLPTWAYYEGSRTIYYCGTDTSLVLEDNTILEDVIVNVDGEFIDMENLKAGDVDVFHFRQNQYIENLEIKLTNFYTSEKIFMEMSALTTLKISSPITVFAACMQGCTNLTTVELPDTVEVIKDNAFGNCKKITQITIPNNVKTIEYIAFYNTGLTSIYLPGNITSIGERAFANCTALTEIKVANETVKTLLVNSNSGISAEMVEVVG